MVKNSQLLTTNEVAEYFKLNKNTIYFLVKSGKVPAIKIGKQWRFNRDQLDSWVYGNIQTEN